MRTDPNGWRGLEFKYTTEKEYWGIEETWFAENKDLCLWVSITKYREKFSISIGCPGSRPELSESFIDPYEVSYDKSSLDEVLADGDKFFDSIRKFNKWLDANHLEG